MEQVEADASSLSSRSHQEDLQDGHVEEEEVPRITTAADELEDLLRVEFAHISGAEDAPSPASSNGFPPKLLQIVLMFPGNHCCVDCGNEEREDLQYGSVGYGTVLCEVCANRHILYTGEESNIQPLQTAPWSLQSILSLLAGSNTQMLQYIGSKPRWRPTNKSADPEEVLAFKQIYLSKAATAYRDQISMWVETTYKDKLMQYQRQIMAHDRLYQLKNVESVDPFDSIFERNHVSREDIPGFSTKTNGSSSRNHSGLGDSFSTVNGGRNRGSISTAHNNPMVHTSFNESLSVDVIKAKICARRNRNPSIRAQAANNAEDLVHNGMRGMNFDDNGGGMEYSTQHGQQQQQHIPSELDYRSYRRRSIDMVGEVNDFNVQNEDYDDGIDQSYWGSTAMDEMSAHMAMAGYGTNNLPRYRNDDVKSVDVSVASARMGRGYDEQTLGSMPYDLSSRGVRLATYRRTSMGGT